MRNTLFAFLLAIPMLTLAQKKKQSGKIYDQHPGITVVDQFHKAFVEGDEETLRSLVTDDFKWWQQNEQQPKPKKIDQLVGRSKYFSKNMLNLSITDRGRAYTDAMEFKGANGAFIYTYKVLRGIDQKTGMILEIPRDESFLLSKDGKKIQWIAVSDSQLKWQKAYDAYGTRRNGTIFKDHPMIAKARLLYAYIYMGDLEGMRSLYADYARISDAMNTEVDSFISPDEEVENFKKYLNDYEVLKVAESGYPDLFEYEGTDTKTIISWWDLTVKNKKYGKIKKHTQHSQIVVNKDGLIIREIYYFNPAQLPK